MPTTITRACVHCQTPIDATTHGNKKRCDECARLRFHLLHCDGCGYTVRVRRRRCPICTFKASRKRDWLKNGEDTRPGIVYALMCPDTRRVRYVGKTGKTLQRRIGQHVRDALKTGRKRHLDHWIRKLDAEGKRPHATVLQECLPGTMNACEAEWIARYRAKGVKLLNTTAGGDGGEWNDEARAKQSERCGDTNKHLARDPAWIEANERGQAARRGMTIDQYRGWQEQRETRRGWNRLVYKYNLAIGRWRKATGRTKKRGNGGYRQAGRNDAPAIVPLTIKGSCLLPVSRKRVAGFVWMLVQPELWQHAKRYLWSAKLKCGGTKATAKANINRAKVTIAAFARKHGCGIPKTIPLRKMICP